MMIFSITKCLPTQEMESVLHYYKNPETLRKQGMHNSAQLWHSRVVRSSNLTFGEFVAGTTSVLSVRSSLLCCVGIVSST